MTAMPQHKQRFNCTGKILHIAIQATCNIPGGIIANIEFLVHLD